MKYIAENLKWLRGLTGLSQQKFSESVGIKKTDLGNWELGNYKPRKEMIEKIAKHFNITTDALMFDLLSESEIALKSDVVNESAVLYGSGKPPEKIDVASLLAYIEILKKEKKDLEIFIESHFKTKK